MRLKEFSRSPLVIILAVVTGIAIAAIAIQAITPSSAWTQRPAAGQHTAPHAPAVAPFAQGPFKAQPSWRDLALSSLGCRAQTVSQMTSYEVETVVRSFMSIPFYPMDPEQGLDNLKADGKYVTLVQREAFTSRGQLTYIAFQIRFDPNLCGFQVRLVTIPASAPKGIKLNVPHNAGADELLFSWSAEYPANRPCTSNELPVTTYLKDRRYRIIVICHFARQEPNRMAPPPDSSPAPSASSTKATA